MTKNLENLFYYIILTLPITFISGSALINIVTVLLALIFIIHIFLNKNFLFLKEHKIFFILIIIFILYQIVNNIINDNADYAFKSISYVRFLIIPILLKYFFYRVSLDIKRIFKVYIIVFIFLIIDLIFQYIFDFNLLNFKPGLYNPDNHFYERYAGMFNQELVMGGFLGSFGFLSILFYFQLNKKNEYLFYFSLIILFFSILITGERASTLSFFISIFFIFLLVKEQRKYLFLTSLVLIILTVISMSFSNQLKSRYLDYPLRVLGIETHYEQKKENLNSRIKKIYNKKVTLTESVDNFSQNSHWGHHYRIAYAMFKDRPFNGFGFKQFRLVCANYSYLFKDEKTQKKVDINIGCSTHPHNYILELMSEQGIFGMIIFFLIIFYYIKNALDIKGNKVLKLMILSLLLSYLFPFKPTGSIISTWYASGFWFMLGFMYIKEKIKN